MKQAELINQFREGLSSVSREVEIASSMDHFDINRICEDLFCDLFKDLYQLPNLKNLNVEEKKNFPGIDLADDEARVAIQVTSDKSLDKIKETIRKIKEYQLHKRYDRFLVYCLTRKQDRYSRESIDKELEGDFTFDEKRDILDFRDLAARAANLSPQELTHVVEILGSYLRGCDVGLADQDFDPPEEPQETLSTNLVELYLPEKLYIAEVRAEILEGKKGSKVLNQRKRVADFTRNEGLPVPSGYQVSGGRLITFYDLEDKDNPFSHLIEEGTAEDFDPSDFYNIDGDHERVFKSLLRLTLQHKLFKHRVFWQFKEKLFIFLPIEDSLDSRVETWVGHKKSQRTVFERKYRRDDPDKVFQVKHFAFSTDFLIIDQSWYISITPDWFFSYGDDYRRSFYADKPLSGLKRMEKNRSVYDQFRFLASWLKDIDQEDLFSEATLCSPFIKFGGIVKIEGGCYLNETLWQPLDVPDEDDVAQGRLGDDDC